MDTRDALRAFGIVAVVANHSTALSLHGGLNLLLLLSGIAFGQLCFGARDTTNIGPKIIRFARPLILTSLAFCAFWFTVFQRFEWTELLMISNWITTERVSKFPIWYPQVLFQTLVFVFLLFLIPGLVSRTIRTPIPYTAAWLTFAVGVACLAQALIDTDLFADKLPHLHAWNFVLGWVFWAVLYSRQTNAAERAILTAFCFPLLLLMFLGLDVPGAEARVWVAIPAVIALIWVPYLPMPHGLAHVTLTIAQAVLFIFFLHYPFILTVREVLGGALPQAAIDGLQFVAGVLGPVLVWVLYTAAQRTFATARRRASGAELPSAIAG